MPRINLLPWREELRKQRQKEFGIMAGLAVVLMACVVGITHMQVAAMISYQDQRNRFLDSEIRKLDKKIKEIKEYEKIIHSVFLISNTVVRKCSIGD